MLVNVCTKFDQTSCTDVEVETNHAAIISYLRLDLVIFIQTTKLHVCFVSSSAAKHFGINCLYINNISKEFNFIEDDIEMKSKMKPIAVLGGRRSCSNEAS